jgi:hypothetical protein
MFPSWRYRSSCSFRQPERMRAPSPCRGRG